MKLGLTWAGLAIGIAGLALQFIITIPLRIMGGDSILGSLVFYFSFFTILTNLMLVLIYAAEIWPRDWLGWFRQPITRGMMAGAISLVMIFYHLILAEAWDPQGFGLVADTTLHYVTPILYLVWWVSVARHGQLKLGDIPLMLTPPTIYLIYVMIRGLLTRLYPYAILDAQDLGAIAVVLNILAVLVGLTALCGLAIGVDRLLSRPRG